MVGSVRIIKVEVKRTLGFRDVSLELVPDLQLVAGPNNAGKSTLIRVLELFFDGSAGNWIREFALLNTHCADEGPRTLSTVTVHFGNVDADEGSVFKSIVRKNGAFSISLRTTWRGSISLETSRNVVGDEARRYYEEVLGRFYFVRIPSVRVADSEGWDSQSLQRLLDTLEAVLVRNGGSRSTNLRQEYATRIRPVEVLVKDLLEESVKSIQMDLLFEGTDVRFELPDARHALRGMLAEAVFKSDGEVSVPVTERGTGFQSAMVLGILRFVAAKESGAGRSTFFAGEEPEAFLHPQTQWAMAKITGDIAKDAQVLVTTHSAVLVDSFSVDYVSIP